MTFSPNGYHASGTDGERLTAERDAARAQAAAYRSCWLGALRAEQRLLEGNHALVGGQIASIETVIAAEPGT